MKGEKKMITKKPKINKNCCLYVSEFHLEMILLPYLKRRMKNSEILIYTQNDLVESIKILLDRTNLNIEDKEKILNIKYWDNKNINKNKNENSKEYTIIINGNKEYIKEINKKIKILNAEVINVVDCYDINNCIIEPSFIKSNYKNILNTENIQNCSRTILRKYESILD